MKTDNFTKEQVLKFARIAYNEGVFSLESAVGKSVFPFKLLEKRKNIELVML